MEARITRQTTFSDIENAHSGFSRDDLDGYLNLFHVIMNEPEDKLEKAAMVLDRTMRRPKAARFREFYNVKPRSER